MSSCYSTEFLSLISSKKRVLELLTSCHFKSDKFSLWEKTRKFISLSINQGGYILDIGCANGFLLKCLIEWVNFPLVPFGIDTDSNLIVKARKLFPKFKENFITMDIKVVKNISMHKLPGKYNLIYWNVWDNWEFLNQRDIKPVDDLRNLLDKSGRLILGFYDKSKQKNLDRISNLKSFGLNPDGQQENGEEPQIICWFDNNNLCRHHHPACPSESRLSREKEGANEVSRTENDVRT